MSIFKYKRMVIGPDGQKLILTTLLYLDNETVVLEFVRENILYIRRNAIEGRISSKTITVSNCVF